ncbi:MAG: Eco57I restriction-modification methylase domain-containing protein [Candidatus Lokiarchaeota archaeon]|nr:Eco57I restriction-modification methylase domain-containing protein [Candidatus Lokiarchaeota archaeon]
MDINKNQLGQIFTPDYMAEFMVKNVKSLYLVKQDIKILEEVKILEPSAGKGVFLKHLISEGFINITAYEIDQKLETSLLEDYPDVKFKFDNFLGSNPNEKFDIIMGNPPYLGQNYNAKIFQELVENYSICKKYFVGNMDLFYFFIHLGIDKLKPGGLLSFITTNYWLTKSKKTGIKYLKPHITNDCYMIQYIDLSKIKIFKDAKGQHNCIFVLQKKNSNEKEKIIDKYIQVIQINKNKDPNLLDHQYNKLMFSKILDRSNHNSIKKYPSALTNNDLTQYDNWSLLYPREVKEIITQIERFCIENEKIALLGDYFSIRNGMILIKDEIFILKESEQILIEEDDILININNEFTKLNPLEKKRLKKIYKSRAIIAYGYIPQELEGYVIYFNKFEFSKLENGDRASQIYKIYPNLNKYLKQYEQDLAGILKNAKENSRDIYYPRRGSHIRQENGNGLINLEPLYDKSPKIFFKFISHDNVFGYAIDQYYATSDTYFLWPKKPIEFTSLFLLAYLNSNIVRFVFKARGLAMKRSKTKIEKGIPLPILNGFKSKEKNSVIELIQLLTKLLVNSANPISDYDVHDFNDELESTTFYLNNPEKKSFKEMIIKAINDKREEDIQAIVDNLFYQLFDLDGKRIDYLMSEYYHD